MSNTIPSPSQLSPNPIKVDLKPIPSTMKVRSVDQEWLDWLNAQINLRASLLTTDEEIDALKREIKRNVLHIELSQAQKGEIPTSVKTKYALYGAIPGIVTLLTMLLGGC